jgi:hypothetical protein
LGEIGMGGEDEDVVHRLGFARPAGAGGGRYHNPIPWSEGGACAGDRRGQPQGRGRQEHAGDQPGRRAGPPGSRGDARRCRPPAVVAAVARLQAAAAAAHPRLGAARRQPRPPAQGHDARGARHARRPARQATGRGDEAGRQGDRAAAAQPVRHPGHPRVRQGAPRPQAWQQGERRRGRHAGARPHHRGDQLRHFLDGLGVPVLGFLRDTQNYVHLAARGLTLWDVAPSRVERDLPQWQPLLDWIAT